MSAVLLWLAGTLMITAAAWLLGWIVACLVLRQFYGFWVLPDNPLRKR